ncbi:hypothetical protein BpHYR1_053970, partial [Brachionus plicatilis]
MLVWMLSNRSSIRIFEIQLEGLSSCTPYRRGFTTSKSSPSTSDQISQASTVVSLTDENRIINSTTFQPNVFGASFLHACDNG